MKYYDQPPDTRVEPYERMMEQIQRGRLAVVIPVRHGKGLKGTYIFSANVDTTLTKSNSLVACVRLAVKAAHAAECEEYEVLSGR